MMSALKIEDPGYRALYEREAADRDRAYRLSPKPERTPHIWGVALEPGADWLARATIAPTTVVLEVRATDMFGQVSRAQRVMNVVPAPPATTDDGAASAPPD